MPEEFEQKFHRPGADVRNGTGRGDRRLTHAGAQFGAKRGRRRLLDHLLMAALNRAFALAEMNDAAVLIGKDLKFDVARGGDRLLQNQAVRTEGTRCLGACTRQRVGKRAFGSNEPHAAAAASSRSLDHQRKADAPALLHQPIVGLIALVIAGNAWYAGRSRQGFGLRLVAHRFDRRRRRADENKAGVGAGACKGGVFREKTVAGVNRIGAREFRRCEKRVNVKVTLVRCRRSDSDSFVRLLNVQRASICVAKHGNGPIAKPFRRAGNAAGNFAAVGNENFAELNHELARHAGRGPRLRGLTRTLSRSASPHSSCVTHDGFRFSTNAAVPSLPSVPRTEAAKLAAASSRRSATASEPPARSISRLVAAIACGAHLST